MKKAFFYVILGVFALTSLWFVIGNRLDNKSDNRKFQSDPKNISLTINDSEIIAKIADTPQSRERGLSGSRYLAENEGLFFVFGQPGRYGFWMKDMNYPIDIIWLDENKKIVDITADFATSSFPGRVTSRLPAKYVIEVNAGWGAKHDIQVGQSVTF